MSKYICIEGFNGELPGGIALTAVAGETVLDSTKDAKALEAWGKFFELVPPSPEELHAARVKAGKKGARTVAKKAAAVKEPDPVSTERPRYFGLSNTRLEVADED